MSGCEDLRYHRRIPGEVAMNTVGDQGAQSTIATVIRSLIIRQDPSPVVSIRRSDRLMPGAQKFFCYASSNTYAACSIQVSIRGSEYCP